MKASDDKDYLCYGLNSPTDDLSKYTLLSPGGGGCVDSQKRYYSYIEALFYYKDYPPFSYSAVVEKCAGWCLQNGPPQYKLLGFETNTKDWADGISDPKYIECFCLFDGNLPSPLPTYIPASQYSKEEPGTGPMTFYGSKDYVCYALNPPTGSPTSRPSARPSPSSSKASKNAKDAKSSSPHAKSAKVSSKEDGKVDGIAQ
eukprot:scaffold12956_cov71-Cyclotella_meneghiniana.AAC.5